ncbi:pantothenate kinase [Lacticaseibacillus rhamnosus MTCC 5462]|nr:pantothenate kinase [Lacticaseibacillus rhamnosus MTCC 5462]
MQSEMNFYKFDRAEWSQFHSQNFTSVTDAELAQLRSLNDEISLDDVKPSIHHYAT